VNRSKVSVNRDACGSSLTLTGCGSNCCIAIQPITRTGHSFALAPLALSTMDGTPAGSAAAAAAAGGVAANSASAASSMSLSASRTAVPRDALAMEQLLASMGLQPGSYQPKVIAQLMEFVHRLSTNRDEGSAKIATAP
jgi:hypothetical protein